MSIPAGWLGIPMDDGTEMAIPSWFYDELFASVDDDRERLARAQAWADLLDESEEPALRDVGEYARALTFARAWATRDDQDPCSDPCEPEHPAQHELPQGKQLW